MIIKINTPSQIPLYLQLRNQIVKGIGKGELTEGESLPTVRQMAADLGINTMTVSKAYQLLSDNKRKLDEIAQYLYEKETISGEEFMRILNAQPQLPAASLANSTKAAE